MSLNSVCLVGRTTKDVEVNYRNDVKVATFTVAINTGKNKDGSDKASFFDCKAFNKLAEVLENTKKGTLLGITGRLVQDRWEKDNQKFSKVYITVDAFTYLSPKDTNTNNSYLSVEDVKEQPKKEELASNDEIPDDLPF